MKNVLIVDDARIAQEMFAAYVKSAPDRYHLVGSIADASNAEVVCLRGGVDLVLMDICTANDASGLVAAGRIKASNPQIKVIMVTSAPEISFLKKAREAGADSFWYKDVSSEELLEVMDRTVAGESIYPDSTPTVNVGLAKSGEFTPTEIKVLYHLVDGLSGPDVAKAMGVDYETVRTHIKHLREKTGATSVTALVRMVTKSQLVMPEY